MTVFNEPILQAIDAREVLDSRGNPTVEVDVTLHSGAFGRASVPSGASTGMHEAVELRDGDLKRYAGKGVLTAVNNIKTIIASALVGKNITHQADLDHTLIALDGTPNKSKLGANALLAVSMAVSKALAAHVHLPLYAYLTSLFPANAMKMPVPMMNILNGGAHADNNVDIQEFMILPVGAKSFSEALQMGVEVFHTLKSFLKSKGLSTSVGDEGGFAPNLRSNTEAIDVILEAIAKTNWTVGRDLYLGLDVACSEWYREGYYCLDSEKKQFSSDEWIAYLANLAEQYPIITIEDGMAENDWAGWNTLTERLGNKIQLVGDDVFVTNPLLLERGIKEHSANAILIKLNQIGTLTETQAAINMASKNGYASVISHRSGETEDTTIADLAVACGCGQIKTGAPCRTDRTAKYNQLLRIEALSHGTISYAGRSAFERFLPP